MDFTFSCFSLGKYKFKMTATCGFQPTITSAYILQAMRPIYCIDKKEQLATKE
jgi:hypothetical protein